MLDIQHLFLKVCHGGADTNAPAETGRVYIYIYIYLRATPPAAGPLMEAGGWRLEAAGCWLLAAGCWLLTAGCWLLAAGCWLLAGSLVVG